MTELVCDEDDSSSFQLTEHILEDVKLAIGGEDYESLSLIGKFASEWPS